MSKVLSFYPREAFVHYKQLMQQEGKKIHSVTQYILKQEFIPDLDPERDIIDLSSIINLKEFQYITEQVLPQFPPEIVFIADDKHREEMSHQLRFCFESFEQLETSFESEFNKTKDSVISSTKTRRIIDLGDTEIESFLTDFNTKLYGHEKFKDDFRELIRNYKVFNALGEHKVLSLFLMGDSGVGKTEVARTIHKCLYSKKKLAKINFGNYSSNDSLNSLIGSPRGYIGSESGELFSRVQDSDIGLILIDEFEKSNPAVFNYFLDVLENGKMTNSLGEEIDVNGYIIVFTSNISKENFKSHISPELRSRFDYKGHFSPLYNRDKQKFIRYKLNSIIKKYEEKHNILLNSSIHNKLFLLINENDYTNMRDLNKKIKSVFVQYITEEQSSLLIEITNERN